MAATSERKDKSGNVISYVIRVYRGYGANDKRVKPYTTTYKPEKGMTAKQIEKELNRRTVAFEERCNNGSVAQDNIKMAVFCDSYLEIMQKKLAPSTAAFYSRVIEKLINPALGAFKLKDIRPTHIQQFVNNIAAMPKSSRNGVAEPDNVISAATVRRYLTVLQSILKLAVKLEYIPDTPAKSEKLTIQKIFPTKISIFSKQEAAEMLACLEREELQFQVLIQLAIYMGARRGELVALKFSDVDFENHKITIERAAIKLKGLPPQTKPPKDYEIRTVTVNAACIELIVKLKAEKEREALRLGNKWNEGDWLFTQWNGEMMNPQTPTKQFSKFLERNSLNHRKFHSLRHTSTTLLLYGGVNIKQVQSRLGHGDIETTNKYLHCIEEADTEAANTLESILNPQAEPKHIKMA